MVVETRLPPPLLQQVAVAAGGVEFLLVVPQLLKLPLLLWQVEVAAEPLMDFLYRALEEMLEELEVEALVQMADQQVVPVAAAVEHRFRLAEAGLLIVRFWLGQLGLGLRVDEVEVQVGMVRIVTAEAAVVAGEVAGEADPQEGLGMAEAAAEAATPPAAYQPCKTMLYLTNAAHALATAESA